MTQISSLELANKSTVKHRFGAENRVRSTVAFDADEHAKNLTNWEQSYDQLSCGQFQGNLQELQLPQMQIFREGTSQAVRQSCCVWPDAFWFGLAESAADTRINGRVAQPEKIMVRPGQCDFELLTPADYLIYGVVIKRDTLAQAAEKMNCQVDWDQLAQGEVMHVNANARRACLRTLLVLLTESNADRVNPEACQLAVTDALLAMLDSSLVDDAVSKSFSRRQRIVAKARDYVLEHCDEAVTVPQLCERLFVSRRTLQYCFEDVLNLSPIQYLRLIRLNGTRRSLRALSNAPASVRDVAANWGFWHFSQFSSDYRKLFGQCPSEARARRAH